MLEENLHNQSEEDQEEIVSNSGDKPVVSKRALLLVNLTKFLIEFVGTATLAFFYLLVGDQQPGILLVVWVVTLFGINISGGHFNPAVTLVQMMRKKPEKHFRGSRLIGTVYILVQIFGGLIGTWIALIVTPNSLCFEPIAQPVFTGYRNFTSLEYYNTSETNQTLKWNGWVDAQPELGQKWISATISEFMGTSFFVLIFMISTDKATKFSNDKVVNCFVIASSYIASRLLSGGQLVTGVNNSVYYTQDSEQSYFLGTESVSRGNFCNKASEALFSYHFINTGPLLNPGIALGQMLSVGNFTYVYAYFGASLGGGIFAGFFYEFVFIKSQEYLHDNEETESENNSQKDPNNFDSQGGRVTDQDSNDEDVNQIDA